MPPGLDGRSFKPILDGMTKTARSELFLAYRHVQRAWRDDRWKLIRYPQVNVTQLFDLETDPDEMHNLAGEPSQAERVQRMLAKLRESQSSFGDTQPLTVDNPQPAAWAPPAAGEADDSKSSRKKKANG